MNEDWNQNGYGDVDASWGNMETPYVSQYTPEMLQGWQGRAAVRSFLVVFLGLIVTTIASYLTIFNESVLRVVFSDGMFQFLLIAEIVVVLVNSWAIKKDNLILSGVLFFAYTVINGVTMSAVFLAYEMGSVMEAFLMAGIVFGVMAAYGYFTKKDLTKIGSICTMALLGVILVSLVNMFLLHSSGLDLIMDYVVVLLFVGITAYDMYKMKQMVAVGGETEINRIALYTGMELYLDFINLFLRLIRIMGKKR
ncbi:MAG: Bax inhibitor-1/YccA family protein [Lachnospiraceae bacterium]|nr:Bax inhibitor-1/YccA family protein [Lachnospiraceae bacterium]